MKEINKEKTRNKHKRGGFIRRLFVVVVLFFFVVFFVFLFCFFFSFVLEIYIGAVSGGSVN